jgi:arabinogalactan endo-1,4-beta-galactosidase
MNIVEAVPNGRGLGVFHWEAIWTSAARNGCDPADGASGNGWENQACSAMTTGPFRPCRGSATAEPV